MISALLEKSSGQAQQTSEDAPKPLLDMALLSKAVDKILKFNCEGQAFDRIYPTIDHIQRDYHHAIIQRIVDTVTKKYHGSEQPIKILDLCCGYGRTSILIVQKLIKNGIKVSKLVGYDISSDMIDFARKHNPFQGLVEFHVKSADKEPYDPENYDVVACIIGLHWLNDLQAGVSNIWNSLKKGGLFFSLTTIQAKDLYEYRKNFANYSKWSSAFTEQAKNIHHFHFQQDVYLNLFEGKFKKLHAERRFRVFNYNRKEYIQYLQSWVQEVRSLTNQVKNELKKDAIGKAYINDFIDSIDKNLTGNVVIREDGSIIHTQHTFDYDGQKI